MIEESHELALAVLREHMEQLHRISQILIERETIDRDQFERLLAGEDEVTVFPEPTSCPTAGPGRRAEARTPARPPAPVPAARRDDAAAAADPAKG